VNDNMAGNWPVFIRGRDLVGKWIGPIGKSGRLGEVGVEVCCGGKRPFYGPLVGVCWGKSVLKKLGG
jgi:hypothetical protein